MLPALIAPAVFLLASGFFPPDDTPQPAKPCTTTKKQKVGGFLKALSQGNAKPATVPCPGTSATADAATSTPDATTPPSPNGAPVYVPLEGATMDFTNKAHPVVKFKDGKTLTLTASDVSPQVGSDPATGNLYIRSNQGTVVEAIPSHITNAADTTPPAKTRNIRDYHGNIADLDKAPVVPVDPNAHVVKGVAQATLHENVGEKAYQSLSLNGSAIPGKYVIGDQDNVTKAVTYQEVTGGDLNPTGKIVIADPAKGTTTITQQAN